MWSSKKPIIDTPSLSESLSSSSRCSYSEPKIHDLLKVSISNTKKNNIEQQKYSVIKNASSIKDTKRSKGYHVNNVIQTLKRLDEKYSIKNTRNHKTVTGTGTGTGISTDSNFLQNTDNKHTSISESKTLNSPSSMSAINTRYKNNLSFKIHSDESDLSLPSSFDEKYLNSSNERSGRKHVIETNFDHSLHISSHSETLVNSFQVKDVPTEKKIYPAKSYNAGISASRSINKEFTTKTENNFGYHTSKDKELSTSGDELIKKKFSVSYKQNAFKPGLKTVTDDTSDTIDSISSSIKTNVSVTSFEENCLRISELNETVSSKTPSQEGKSNKHSSSMEQLLVPIAKNEVQQLKFNHDTVGLSTGMYKIFTIDDLVMADDVTEDKDLSLHSATSKKKMVLKQKDVHTTGDESERNEEDDSYISTHEEEIAEDIEEVIESHDNIISYISDNGSTFTGSSVKTSSSYEKIMKADSILDNSIGKNSNKRSTTSKQSNVGLPVDNDCKNITGENILTEDRSVYDSNKDPNLLERDSIKEQSEFISNEENISSVRPSHSNLSNLNEEWTVLKNNMQSELKESALFISSQTSSEKTEDSENVIIKMPSSFKKKYRIVITERGSARTSNQDSIDLSPSTKSKLLKADVPNTISDKEGNTQSSGMNFIESKHTDRDSINVHSGRASAVNTLVESEELQKRIRFIKDPLPLDVRSCCSVGIQTDENFENVTVPPLLSVSASEHDFSEHSVPVYRYLSRSMEVQVSPPRDYTILQFLKQQIELTRHFINSQKTMYEAYCSSIKDISGEYKPITLEETRQYIKNQRKSRDLQKNDKNE